MSGRLDVAAARRDAGGLKEVGKQCMAVLGGDAFGMELHAMHGMLPVLQAHDQAVGSAGGHCKAAGETFALDDQKEGMAAFTEKRPPQFRNR